MSVVVDVDLGTTMVDGMDCIQIAVSSAEFTVIIDVPRTQIGRFANVAASRWIEGAIPIGMCASTRAFWSVDDGKLSVLLGQDDQTWSVALSLPAEALDRIRTALSV